MGWRVVLREDDGQVCRLLGCHDEHLWIVEPLRWIVWRFREVVAAWRKSGKLKKSDGSVDGKMERVFDAEEKDEKKSGMAGKKGNK